jgi:phage major head subunit gpT-like protein
LIISNANLDKLRSAFNTLFQKGLKDADEVHGLISTPVTSSTKIETYGFLGDMPIFRRWVGEKRIKSLGEKAYQLINEDFEATIGIHKNKIKDDNLGLYNPIVTGWGQNAAKLPSQLVFEALAAGHQKPCFDGQNFFDNDHPVGDDGTIVSNISAAGPAQPWYLVDASQPMKPILYQVREAPHFHMVTEMEDSHVFRTGEYLMGAEARASAGYTYWQMAFRSTQTLNAANYTAARDAMMGYKDDEGQPLAIKPTHIIVGTSNWQPAKDLFKKALIAGGESNTLFEEVEIVLAKRLP